MILFFHQAALGDFVLTFPILRALARGGEPVTVISTWSKALLAQKVIGTTPMSIELFEFTRLYAPGGPTALSPAVREVFDGVTQVISFVAKPGEPWADNVARLCPAATLAFVEPRPAASLEAKLHVADWHVDQLTRQGVRLTPIAPTRSSASSGPIVVHPGSGGIEKCWPAESFVTLIESLRKDGREVVPILGEVELERWPSDVIAFWSGTLGAEPIRDLLTLHDTLARASLFIGNDSGPTHLAAELGVPTIALFGPSDANRWSPRGAHVTTLAPPKPRALEWLSPEAVLAAARGWLLP